jgi:hypothetical protein
MVHGLVAGKESIVAVSVANNGASSVVEWAHPGPEVVADTPDLPATLPLNHDIGRTPTCILVRHSNNPDTHQ